MSKKSNGCVQKWTDSATGQRGNSAIATGKNKQCIAHKPERVIPISSQKDFENKSAKIGYIFNVY